MIDQSTICAITTPPGMGAIATIRLSGAGAIEITEQVFNPALKGKTLIDQAANTLHYGQISDQAEVIDEVVVALFRSPRSFTGEDVIEISCHGSVYIQQRILQLLIKKGARMASPGEFSQRAFLNGKMDLSQAEAVADLIASQSEAAHKIALKQMKGGVSVEINNLRNELVHFVSLIELELDFGEEDVEFANRDHLLLLIERILLIISNLTKTFTYGNAIKRGIPVAIVGGANTGKSTLLNRILKEDKAIVSHIAGTTRDVIEDVAIIAGIQFRFIDTAGIRDTNDIIETKGIEKTFLKIEQAEIVLIVIDATDFIEDINLLESIFREKIAMKESVFIINKIDIAEDRIVEELKSNAQNFGIDPICISAKNGDNFVELENYLIKVVEKMKFAENDVIISNVRHYEALQGAIEPLDRVIEGLKNDVSGDFLSQDIREALYSLGSITGHVSTHEILGNIFKNFCIGK